MNITTTRFRAALARTPKFNLAILLLFPLLTAQAALAGQWWAAQINGQGGPNGRVFDHIIPRAVVPEATTFHVIATGQITQSLYEGVYTNGDWHWTTAYSDTQGADPMSASAVMFNNYLSVAHVDRDLKLRLSMKIFGHWITQVVDGQGQATWNNFGVELSTVVYGGKLYIFYHESNQPWVGKNVLRCAIYDGTNFIYQVIDGGSMVLNRILANLSDPAAVVAPDGLRLYYYDVDHGRLREAFSKDGLNWINFANLDGPGGVGGSSGDVGHHPSAIVFKGSVNVFYEDRTNARLRMAQLSGGKWTFGQIDTLTVASYNAPIVHGDAIHVYYTSAGQLRGAWGASPNAFSVLPIDGPGGVASGATGDTIMAPVAALETSSATPSVFYEDGITGALRNGYWLP